MRALLLVAILGGTAWAKPPHGVKRIAIDYKWQSFTSDERHYVIEWDGAKLVSARKPIDPALVDGLYAKLGHTREVDSELSCMSHTDDYPSFHIEIEGDEPLVITSNSNCHAYAPWNIHRGGKTLAQLNGDVWRGLAPLLAAADTKWSPNVPAAYTTTGGELVDLGAAGGAADCAKRLATLPAAKAVFGEFTVEGMDVLCDMGHSAECTELYGQAKLAMQGVHAEVVVGCNATSASIPAEAAPEYEGLLAFVGSVPVRTLVKLAGADRVRLWNQNGWRVEAEKLPGLSWTPKSAVIHAELFGQDKPDPAFWKAIGVDPLKFANRDHGFVEIDVPLGFDGKVRK